MNYSYSLERSIQALSYGKILARALIFIGLISYSLSLYSVALFTSGDDLYGIWMLLLGWFGLFFFQLSWLANPLNLLALLLISKKPKVSLLLTIIAFLVASQTFLFSEIPINFNQEKIFIKEFGIGFYLWYMANGLFAIGVLIENLSKDKPRNN